VVDALITGAFLFLGVLTFYYKYPVWRIGWALPLAIWQMTMVHWVISSPTRSHYYILTTGGVGLFIMASLLTVSGFVFGL
jgi:hypothetical protein